MLLESDFVVSDCIHLSSKDVFDDNSGIIFFIKICCELLLENNSLRPVSKHIFMEKQDKLSPNYHHKSLLLTVLQLGF